MGLFDGLFVRCQAFTLQLCYGTQAAAVPT